MKFSSIKPNSARQYTVKALNGGILPENGQYQSGGLAECKNMWFKDGLLQTRPGISASADSAIVDSGIAKYDLDGQMYYVSDGTFNINGKECKILCTGVCIDDSIYKTNIYFVDTDGGAVFGGYIMNGRTTSDVFLRPVEYTFFKENRSSGDGIYGVFRLENIYDTSETEYRIYKYNPPSEEWNIVFGNMYTPTVYINGRGNNYLITEGTGEAYTEDPMGLESVNVMSSMVNAYYSSDGRSSTFRLPSAELMSGNLRCRIYREPSKYTEWSMDSSKTSCTVNFYNADITMTVDKVNGIVKFTDKDGDYPIPMMENCRANNIVFYGVSNDGSGEQDIASCKNFVTCNSVLYASGGKKCGRIYTASTDNTLYFPKDSVCEVGDRDDPVTALAVMKGKTVAFKNHEIYAITYSDRGTFDVMSPLSVSGKVFKKADKVSAELIRDDVGCMSQKTVVSSGGGLIWLGTDRKFYAMNGFSAAAVKNFECTVQEKLNSESDGNIKKAFAVCSDGYYILFVGNRAFVCNISKIFNNSAGKNGVEWYIWEFPVEICFLGGDCSGQQTTLICADKATETCYIAALSGSFDARAVTEKDKTSANFGRVSLAVTEIGAEFKTLPSDLSEPSSKKSIERINLFACSQNALNIKISADGETRNFRLDPRYTGVQSAEYELKPSVWSAERVGLSVTGTAPFGIGSVCVRYKKNIF